MFQYLAKRLIMMVPLLIGITLISFVVIHLAPGEPTDLATQLNPDSTAELKSRLRAEYGLDNPLHVQYFTWLGRLVTLDFGTSFSNDRRPVLDKIIEKLPVTILLNVLSMIFILGIAIPLGVISAIKQNSLFDRSTTIFVFVGFATPSFWLALLMMDWFGVRWGLLPISGLTSYNFENMTTIQQVGDMAKHLVLPVFISAFGGFAGMSRYVRSNMLEVVRQDYIVTARAKGLSERRVILVHALRNALLPVITILGLSIPGLIGGSVIFETIFAIPGMGKLFYDGVMMRDYPLIMGILVLGAVLTLVGNMIADLSYALADPRIRES